MTCKMRLRGKVRRQTGATEDEKLEHFVSAEIYEKIRNAFPDAVAMFEQGDGEAVEVPEADDAGIKQRRQELREGELREE